MNLQATVKEIDKRMRTIGLSNLDVSRVQMEMSKLICEYGITHEEYNSHVSAEFYADERYKNLAGSQPDFNLADSYSHITER